MSSGLLPICFDCARFAGVGPEGWMCEAYTQIPSVILVNGADHRDAYPGDGGLRFLARAPKADVEYEPTAAHHERRCELCAHFLPPDHCRRVVGEISAQGWCKLWTAVALFADACLGTANMDAAKDASAGWDKDKIRRRKAWAEFYRLIYSRDFPDFSGILGSDWASHLPMNKTSGQYKKEAQRLMLAKYGDDPPFEEVPPEFRYDDDTRGLADGTFKRLMAGRRDDAVEDDAALQVVRILLRKDGFQLRLMRTEDGTESYAVVDLGGRYLWFAATEAEGRRKFQELSGSGRADGIAVPAAGVMIICNGSVLLCRRTDTGEWAFPAGHVEDGETVEEAAARECEEETGFRPEGMLQWTRRVRDGVDFTTFACRVPERFEPVLNAEHDAYEWIDMSDAVELPVGGGDGAPEQVSVT